MMTGSRIAGWLAQLAKTLGPGSIPREDKLDSGFYPSGVGKMRRN